MALKYSAETLGPKWPIKAENAILTPELWNSQSIEKRELSPDQS
jgi:hypothetical protein